MAERSRGTDREASIYRRWNRLTATCYARKMKCEGCPNDYICKMNIETFNKYRMPQIKYAVLMTYSRCGTNNIERYLNGEDEDDEEL